MAHTSAKRPAALLMEDVRVVTDAEGGVKRWSRGGSKRIEGPTLLGAPDPRQTIGRLLNRLDASGSRERFGQRGRGVLEDRAARVGAEVARSGPLRSDRVGLAEVHALRVGGGGVARRSLQGHDRRARAGR